MVTNDADRDLGSITLTPNDHEGQYEAGTKITATANESKILKFTHWDGQQHIRYPRDYGQWGYDHHGQLRGTGLHCRL